MIIINEIIMISTCVAALQAKRRTSDLDITSSRPQAATRHIRYMLLNLLSWLLIYLCKCNIAPNILKREMSVASNSGMHPTT